MPEKHTNPESFQVKIEVGKSTHKGLVRTHNEDSLMSIELSSGEGNLKERFIGLYAVADGLGGYEGGEIASSLALRTLEETIAKSLMSSGLNGKTQRLNQEVASQILTEGVKSANNQVHTEAGQSGMGTTLAAVLIINKMAYIANVGDSRVYLLDQGQLRQITNDHSLVASLVAAGEITPEEVYTHPQRNIITRSLGTRLDIEVDLFTKELHPSDSLMLCSDGLWEMVRDNEIREVVLEADGAQSACERLVKLANQNGGVDNISVIIVKVSP